MPSPYQQELFNAIVASGKMDISVRYFSATASDRDWERRTLSGHERIMPSRHLNLFGCRIRSNPEVLAEIRRADVDLVIVSDYSFLTAQVAMWYLTCTGRKWLYWGERPGMKSGVFRGWARQILMLPIRYGAAGISAIGSLAEKSYRELFGSKKLIMNIPYFCDLERYRELAPMPHLRIKVLYCGQFIVRKGLDILLQAFIRIAKECPDVDLVLAGGNPDSPFLKGLIPDNLRDRIEIAGFYQPENLPTLYARADIFVLPSRHDGWGIVVNEALGAGLPVIASDQVGAVHDLIVHGENGYIFPSGDAQKLADYLRLLAESSELRRRFSEASRQRSELFGLEEGVRRWKHVCELVIENNQNLSQN